MICPRWLSIWRRMKMSRRRELWELIDECVKLEDENTYIKQEDEKGKKNLELLDILLGTSNVKKAFEEYYRNLLDVAEILDDNDFDTSKFKDRLNKNQFFWLDKNKGKIKRYLRER
jgi:hypothetical protein